jgi:hypothetical protein
MRRRVGLLITSGIAAPLLCVTLFALVTTWSEAYVLWRHDGPSVVRAQLHGGVAILTFSRDPNSRAFTRWYSDWVSTAGADKHLQEHDAAATKRRGFGPLRLLSGTRGAAATFSLLRVPFWPLLLVLAIPVVRLCFVADLLHRKSGLPLCPACGYDLTGCVKRCAECGWTMPYRLVLTLALRRDARNRQFAATQSARVKATIRGKKKPTESSVGSA